MFWMTLIFIILVQCFFFGDQFEFEMHQNVLGEMFYIVNVICCFVQKNCVRFHFVLDKIYETIKYDEKPENYKDVFSNHLMLK